MLIYKGIVEGIKHEETKDGKRYQKLYFRNDHETGGFSVDIVKDYKNNDVKEGDGVECEVFASAWATKNGAAVDLIASKIIIKSGKNQAAKV
jgi:hypothetical protein